MKISGALIEALVNLLKGVGLLNDPAEEVEFRRQVTELEKSEAQVWVEFVRATTPDPARVYMWANSVIALVRPTISTLIVAGMIFAPSRILDLVRTFGEAGPAGWIVMAPVLWWFFGRDVSKVLAMKYGGTIEVGSGAIEPETSAPRVLRSERGARVERIDSQLEELSEGVDVRMREFEFDRPVDR